MRARAAVVALCLAGYAQAEPVLFAQFEALTDRYSHQVFAEPANWSRLRIETGAGVTVFELPEALVYEDRTPRLWEMTGDGLPEVVVVESSLTEGARLAVYDATGRIAATPFIGRSNRWLAPVGAVDLDGDGRIEVAYVDRPHLAKVLRVWRMEDGALVEVAFAEGLTNHRLGSNDIEGGLRDCGDRAPELITASADWSQIVATSLVDGALVSRVLGPYDGPLSLQSATGC